MRKTAVISTCGKYRYWLGRDWDEGANRLVWIMLNPSTADAEADDATIKTITRLSKRFDFDGLIVVNLFAFRATDPKDMLKAADPIGQENDVHIRSALQFSVNNPVVAWGATGAMYTRAADVLSMIREEGKTPLTLGLTKHMAAPRHPLYTKEDTAKLEEYKHETFPVRRL